MSSTTEKFFSMFFGPGQKAIDPATFNINQFNTAHTAPDAMALLKFSVDMKNEEYIKSALNMIYRLYYEDNSRTIATQLGDLGICSLIDSLFAQKINEIQMCNHCLQVMYILIASPNSENSLHLTTQSQRKSSTESSSAASSIFSGLTGAESTAASIGILSAVANTPSSASDVSANKKRLSTSGTIFRLIKCGQVHINEVSLLLTILKIVRELMYDVGTTGRLVSCGLCDLLTQMLRQHTLNESILPVICEVIYQIILMDLDECEGANQCQDKFAEFYVCEQMIKKILLVATPLTNLSIVWVLKAIGALARRHEGNKKRFASVDGCEIIPSLAKERSLEDSLLAEAVCWAIGNLAFPDEANQLSLGERDACGIIFEILRLHSQNRHVVQEGMRAIRNLCLACEVNIQRVIDLRGTSFCLELLQMFAKEPDVLQWIMYALASMSDYEPARLLLGQEKITEQIAQIFRQYSHSTNEDIIQWTALVAAGVAKDRSLASELHDLNICNDLIQAIARHGQNSDLLEEVLNVMSALALVSEKSRILLIENSIYDFLLKILNDFESQETTVEQALVAFSSILSLANETISVSPEDSALCLYSFLADDRVVSRASLARHYKHFVDGCMHNTNLKVLSKVTKTHYANGFIALHGVQSLCSLALGAFLRDRADIIPSDRVLSVLRVGLMANQRGVLGMLGDIGVISTLVLILSAHPTDPLLVRWTLYGLLQMCSIEKNMETLRQTEISLIISKLLEIYYLSSEATEILVLLFELIVQLSIFADLRAQLGSYFMPGGGRAGAGTNSLPTHSLMTALAHHLSSVDALRAGSEAMSAICISPLEDALSAIYKQDQSQRRKSSSAGRASFTAAMNINLTGSASPATPSLNNPVTLSDADGIDWIKFQADKPETDDSSTSQVVENVGDIAANKEPVSAATAAKGFFNFSSFFKTSGGSNDDQDVSSRNIGGIGKAHSEDKKGITAISTIDSYNLLPAQSNQSLLYEAASNIISAGLSDQDEGVSTHRSRGKARKSSGEALIEAGAVALLVAAMQSHPKHEGVLCSTLNALNSLAVSPINRRKFNDPLVYEVLVMVLRTFTMDDLAMPQTSSEELISSSSDREDGPPAVAKPEPSRRMSVKTLQTQLEAVRAVKILLLICIGTICMPVADEESGQHTHKSHKKHIATNAYTFHEISQEQFAKLGIFDVVFHMLSQHQSDGLICEALLRAIYYLLKGNASNQTSFAVVGQSSDAEDNPNEGSDAQLSSSAVTLLVDILQQNQDKPRIVYYACLAISAVAGDHRENSAKMGRNNVCETVMKVFRGYLDKAEIAQACCQVIFSLKALNAQWNEFKACEVVLSALNTHSTNSVVAEWVCRVIGSLAEYDANKIELEKHHVSKVITMALQKHVSTDNLLFSAFTKDTSSPGVARWGCSAIYYLAKGYESHLFQRSLVSAGACEAVAKALVKYSEVESVAYTCCRALVVLLIGNEPYKAKLGGLGVCSCVVESLHLFPASAQVAKWGCRAVAVLAENNEANIGKLAISGACETIPLVLQAHPSNEHIATAGCDVISFMSEQLSNGYAARFGHAGACEAVVSVLRKHPASSHVVARASISLSSLARVPGNARWFGPAGATEALFTVLCLHKKEKSVAKYIVSAIGNLCLVDHNKERLGAIGVCEEVIETANLHERDLDTAIASSSALWKLCETIHKSKAGHGIKHVTSRENNSGHEEISTHATTASNDVQNPPRSGDGKSDEATVADERERARLSRIVQSNHYKEGRRNRAIFLEGKVCETLIHLLNFHLADPMAAETISHAISVFATPGTACEEERAQLGELGACEAIVKTLSFHEGEEDVARWTCLAVRALCYQSPANQERFHQTQLASLLVVSLRGFRQSSEIANHQALMEAVLGAVINLSTSHARNKALLGENGVCEGLLELLDLHIRNQSIIYLAVKALFHICDGNQLNRMKISFSGAADFLMNCLSKYPDEDKMVDFILAIMIGMCFDKVGQSKLGSVGMCKYIITLISKYEKSSDYLLVLTVTLAGILANNSKANQEKLGANNIQKILLPILQRAVQTAASSNTSSALQEAKRATFFSKTFRIRSRSPQVPPSPQYPTGKEEKEVPRDQTAEESDQQKETREKEKDPDGNVSLTDYLGDFSLMKECCRSIYFLVNDHESNRQKFLATNVLIDLLTTILSASNDDSFPSEAKDWAKQAMDSLLSHTA